MFRLIETSSGQIQNTVLVHSVSAHYGISYCLQNYIDLYTTEFYIYSSKYIG